MKRNVFYLSLLASSALFMLSCDDDKNSKDACTDKVCSEGFVCVEGECIDQCTGVNCNTNEVCVKGLCVDAQTQLCQGVSCNTDEFCVLGVCKPNTQDPCEGKVCGEGEVCSNGDCVSNDACLNVVCEPDQECKLGYCQPLDRCALIRCDVGYECIDGVCEVKVPDPCATVVCGTNQVCQNGTCYDKSIYPCLGVVCNDDEQCNKGVCEPIVDHVDLEEPKGNVLPNWDFEEWSAGMPVQWVTGGAALTVTQNTAKPKSRLSAVTLNNDITSNARLESVAFKVVEGATSDPLSLRRGRYQCSAWIKGMGTLSLGARLSDSEDSSKGNYKYAGSVQLMSDTQYKESYFSFNATQNIQFVTVVLSVKSTQSPHITVDAVSCVREATKCDDVSCNSWEQCKELDGKCYPLSERCNAKGDCAQWQKCDEEHRCVLDTNRCLSTADCDENSATPKCDIATKTCIAGDPCEGVTCDEWKLCSKATGTCVLGEGRCVTSADCLKDKPACDAATHTCEAATHACNIFPNGGFETWDNYEIPYKGTHLIPDAWYGLFEGVYNPHYSSEIDPAAIKQYTSSTHSGQYAMQVVFPKQPAERLSSEDFAIPAGVNYTCSYWVRGKGEVQHRWVSQSGLATATPRLSVDSLDWQRVPFEVKPNSSGFRFVFYISNTDAAKDHIQIDDVVCTKN